MKLATSIFVGCYLFSTLSFADTQEEKLREFVKTQIANSGASAASICDAYQRQLGHIEKLPPEHKSEIMAQLEKAKDQQREDLKKRQAKLKTAKTDEERQTLEASIAAINLTLSDCSDEARAKYESHLKGIQETAIAKSLKDMTPEQKAQMEKWLDMQKAQPNKPQPK